MQKLTIGNDHPLIRCPKHGENRQNLEFRLGADGNHKRTHCFCLLCVAEFLDTAIGQATPLRDEHGNPINQEGN